MRGRGADRLCIVGAMFDHNGLFALESETCNGSADPGALYARVLKVPTTRGKPKDRGASPSADAGRGAAFFDGSRAGVGR